MAKIKLQANKLENAEVSHISLVQRGANRIPFRIIKRDKQEHGMIDLAKLFKAEKSAPKEEVGCKVLGIVVEKSDNLEPVEAVLKAEGFSTDKSKEVDGTVIYSQVDGDIDPATTKVVKMSQDVLAFVDDATVEKLLDGADGYESVLKEHGFLPSISMAAVDMHNQIMDAVSAGEDVVQKAETIIDGFKAYVLKSVELLPAELFQVDFAVSDVKKAETVDKEESVEKTDPEPDTPEPEVKPVEAPPAKVEEPKVDELEPLEAIKKMIEGLAGQIKELQPVAKEVSSIKGELQAIKDANELVGKQLKEVDSVAKAATAAIKGTVIGAPPAGDTVNHKQARKADDDPRTGMFDTAFLVRKAQPHARKSR